MSNAFRVIPAEEVREPVDHAAALDVPDATLRARGVRMDARDWWDGLGSYRWAWLELATGEQVLLARFDDGPPGVVVQVSLSADVSRAIRRLVAALEIPAAAVKWSVEPAAWADWQTAWRDRATS